MNRKKLITTSTIFLASLIILSTMSTATAVTYPYSVSTGDKITYNITELKNGTYSGWLMVWGINMSKGDTVKLEVYDRPANPAFPYGSEFTLRFVEGDTNGDTFPGHSMIFSNNKTYWQNSISNNSFDVGGTIYSYSLEGDTASWSWTTDADNYVKITFDINDGLLRTFERKTENDVFYGYTHLKFVKGDKSIIPSFDIPITIAGLFIGITVIKQRKKQ